MARPQMVCIDHSCFGQLRLPFGKEGSGKYRATMSEPIGLRRGVDVKGLRTTKKQPPHTIRRRGRVWTQIDRAPVLPPPCTAGVITAMPMCTGMDQHEVESHRRRPFHHGIFGKLCHHSRRCKVGAVIHRRIIFASIAINSPLELFHQPYLTVFADFLRVVSRGIDQIGPLLRSKPTRAIAHQRVVQRHSHLFGV